MNNRFTIGLRTFILGTSLLGIVFAFGYIWVVQPQIQAGRVKSLIDLGGDSPGCYGVQPRILVWYGEDVRWIEEEERFILKSFEARFDYQSKPGNDRQDHPVAVEIYCDPDPEKLKRMLDRLPTIEQLWICAHLDSNGLLIGHLDLEKLQELFPDHTICSPRIWGKRWVADQNSEG